MKDGFLNILKPPGMTSHDVVNLVRRRLGRKAKVGHLGTLDPAAAGVLPLALGQATRFITHLPPALKGYRALLRWGVETETLDLEGRVLRTDSSPLPSGSAIQACLPEFVGRQQQVPPAVSAIRVQGKRSYERVRGGEAVELAPREIEILELQLGSLQERGFWLDVVCGPGTYVRSLARDLGARLGGVASLDFLLRFRSGDFFLESSYTLEEYLDGRVTVRPIAELFEALPQQPQAVRQKGQRLEVPEHYPVGERLWLGEALAEVVSKGSAKVVAVIGGA